MGMLCLALVACVDPPPPTKTVLAAISVDGEGCPQARAVTAAQPNDKVSWFLDADSPGYPGVEAFGVAFTDSNPTYCVNAAQVGKTETITCTVKVDAPGQPVCYALATHANGGTQTCARSFVLRIGDGPDTAADLCERR